MKLATYRNGTRDGQLMVVSRDLTKAVAIPAIASCMQELVDNWDELAPKADAVYQSLNQGDVEGAVTFEQHLCESPLPRAYQWADGSAYVNHVELVRKARGAEMPPSFWEDPLMYQGGSDDFLAPHDDIEMGSNEWGIDFEGEIAVITDDVPMGIEAKDASQHIKLLMLVNDVSLRALIPAELGKGFGFFQSKPASSFSPVAVTPDELGKNWRDDKVHLPLTSHLNNEWFGSPEAGIDMTFSFAQLIAHAAKTRRLTAGTIIGSGTVSNLDRSKGSSCLAEKRMLETIEHGQPQTPFMRFGDRIRIEMLDSKGQSIFGAIDQRVKAYITTEK